MEQHNSIEFQIYMIVCITCLVSYGIVCCKVCNHANNNTGYCVLLSNTSENTSPVFVNKGELIVCVKISCLIPQIEKNNV